MGAMLAHGVDQKPRAGRQHDAGRDHLVDHRDRQALQQRHALAKRRLERDLAAHRAFGDGRDMRLETCEIGKLVDAFLTDHGGIHVGDQQHLAPMRQRLHHHVEFAVQGIAQDIGEGARVGAGFRARR